MNNIHNVNSSNDIFANIPDKQNKYEVHNPTYIYVRIVEFKKRKHNLNPK